MNMPSIVRSTPFIAPALLVMIAFLVASCAGERTRNDAEPYEKETIAQLLGLANYLESNGDRATAAAVYRRIVDDDRATATMLMDIAGRLEAANALDSAAAAYGRVQQLDPKNAKASENLGRVLLRLGRLDKSIEALEQWVYLEGNKSESYLNLAAALDFAGRHRDAQNVYEQGLAAFEETDPTLSINYALSLALAGDFPLAVKRANQTLTAIDGKIDRRHLRNAVLIHALAGQSEHAKRLGKPLGNFETDLILRQADQLNELENSAARARSLGGYNFTL